MAIRKEGTVIPLRRLEDRVKSGPIIDYWVETRNGKEFHMFTFASGHTQTIVTQEPVMIIGPKE
jgi:hypothetical protein